MDEKNIEVKLVNGNLTIKGEKKEEHEEKKKDYYLSERKFGSFERSFTVPEGVDADKIEASFKKGVLTVKLPKKPEAVKPKKKIGSRPQRKPTHRTSPSQRIFSRNLPAGRTIRSMSGIRL